MQPDIYIRTFLTVLTSLLLKDAAFNKHSVLLLLWDVGYFQQILIQEEDGKES